MARGHCGKLAEERQFFVWGMLATALTLGVISAGCESSKQHEHIWGEWVPGTPVLGKWQTDQPATHVEAGTKYRNATRTDTRTCTLDNTTKDTQTVTHEEDTSLRETGIIPIGKRLNANREEADLPPRTLPDITPKDVKVIERLGNGGSTIIANVTAPHANGALTNILSDFSTQADGLLTFFNTVKSSYPTLAAKFEELRAAEQRIKNRANTVNKSGANNPLTGYAANIDAHIDGMLDSIFADAAGRAEFEKYYEAYHAGKYLLTRDWGTVNNDGYVTVGSTGSNFPTTLTAIGKDLSSPGYGGQNIDNGRGIVFTDLKSNNYNALMGQISTEMQTRIVSALGLTGVTNADQMTKALITQIGDNDELRALIDDFSTKSALNVALTYDYSVAGYQEIAGAQTQSSAKLSHLSPDVDLTKRGINS
jgi:hypothetical protein